MSITARANVAVLAVLAALVVLLLASGSASAHFLKSDPVDGNEQINYRNYTKYDAEVDHARYWWNELDTRHDYRGVRITVDTDSTTADLDVGDYSDCGTTTAGKWVPRDGPDDILFNRCNLDNDSAFDRKSTGTHEFGHALRLDHTEGPSTTARGPSCTPARNARTTTRPCRTTTPTTTTSGSTNPQNTTGEAVVERCGEDAVPPHVKGGRL